MSDPILIRHARHRAWNRLGWASDDLSVRCQAAWLQSQGLSAALPLTIRRKVMRVMLGHPCRVAVRVLNGVLFLFGLGVHGWALMTVYPLTRAALFVEAA